MMKRLTRLRDWSARLWQKWTEPAASLRDPELRRLSKVLAATQLPLLALDLVVGVGVMPRVLQNPSFFQSPIFLPTVLAVLLTAVTFLLNRAGRYYPAAILSIATFLFVPWLTVYLNPEFSLIPLAVMSGGVLMASVLMPGGWVFLLTTAATILGPLSLPFLRPDRNWTGFASILTVMVVYNILIFVVTFYRSRLDRERQVELRQTNLELVDTAEYVNQRMNDIIEQIVAFASLDFARQASIENRNDLFDAVATGLNALGEELKASVVSRTYLDNIVGSMSDALVVVGADEMIQTVNQAAVVMFARAEEELIGQPLSGILPGEALEALRGHDFLARDIHELEVTLRSGQGHVIPALLSISPLLGADGVALGAVFVAHDITGRKRAEEKLRISEERYRSLAQNLPDSALMLFDTDLRFIIADGPEIEATGFSRAMLEGKTLYEALPPEFAQVVEPNMRRTLAGERFVAELPYEDRIYRYSYVPLQDAQGDTVLGMILATNVTQLKKAESALRDSQRRLSTALRATQVGVWELDIHTETAYWSEEMYHLMGLDPETDQPSHENWAKAIHSDDLAVADAKVVEAIETKSELANEFRVVWPDGSIHWIQDIGNVLLDEKGETRAMFGIQMDITGRKKIEQELEENRRRLAFLLSGSPSVIYSAKAYGDFGATFISANVAAMLGHPPEAFTDKTGFWVEHIHPDDLALIQTGVDLLFETGLRSYEYRFRKADGEYAWVRDEKSLIRDEAGNPLEIIGALTDVTQRRLAEDALRRSEALLNATNEIARTGGWELDLRTNELYWTDITRQIHELPPQYAPTLADALKFYTPEDLPNIRAAVEQGSAGTPFDYELQIVTAKGNRRWVRAMGRPVYENGKVVKLQGAFQDIHERKEAEVVLQESETRYRLVSELTSDYAYAFRFNPDGTFQLEWVTKAFTAITGHSLEIAQSLEGWQKMVHPDDFPMLVGQIQKLLAGETVDFEMRVVRPDGQVIWEQSHGQPWRDKTGAVIGFHGAATNITQRKMDELALLQANLVVEQSPVVLFRWRAEPGWPVELVSQNVTQFGYSQHELLSGSVPYASLVHPDDLEQVAREVAEFNARGVTHFQQEYRIITKDGKVRWVEDQTVVERDALGRSVRYQGTVMDITERVRTQRLLRALSNAAMAADHTLDADDLFRMVGEELARLEFYYVVLLRDPETETLVQKYVSFDPGLVRQVEALVGFPAADIRIPYQDIESVRRIVEDKEPQYFEGNVLNAMVAQVLQGANHGLLDDINRLLNISRSIVVPMVIENTVVGVIYVQSESLLREDIPAFLAFANQLSAIWRKVNLLWELESNLEAKRRTELELIQHRDHLEDMVALRTQELETANAELSSFAYIASHDLKAPLRAISQLSSWIVDDYSEALDEEGRARLRLLIDRTRHMHRLIDGILQYSRIGRVAEKPVSVDLDVAVRDIINILSPPASVDIAIEGRLPTVIGEQTHITQVFQNLLSNAMQYIDKPKGYITIKARSEQNHWLFAVADNGPGIDAKYFEKIFQIFQTLGTHRDTESTGIGLALVKKIVEKWGGSIWVESVVGQGSTFLFTMPINRSEP